MDELGHYLDAIDDHLPTLRQDLVELAEVADAYDVAAPDLLDTLDNVTVTSKTIVEKQPGARRLLLRPRRARRDLDPDPARQRAEPGPRSARSPSRCWRCSRTYSPEFPCLLKGAANVRPDPLQDVRGRLGQAVHRVLQPPVARCSTSGTSRCTARSATVRGAPGCPNFKVPGTPRAARPGQRPRREPAAQPGPELRRASRPTG